MKTLHQIHNRTITNRRYIIGFAFLFMFLGWFIPQIFYKYMPASYFYNVSSISVRQTQFGECPETELEIVRHTRYNMQGSRTIELVILHDIIEQEIDVGPELREKLDTVFVLEKTVGHIPLHLSLPVPCDVHRNEHYKWRVYIVFDIEGYTKQLVVQSDPFIIQ